MPLKKIAEYRTFVFDCDGVILDSNRIKTDAFYETTISYGEELASKFIEYHRINGGVSRYKKFEFFFSDILKRAPKPDEMNLLLSNYANLVWDGLLSCKVTDGLSELRRLNPESRWLVVSGGDQEELRRVFVKRNLIQLFDGGIYGGPDSKDEILAREVGNGNIQSPGLFIGDSRYDFHASTNVGLDFLFITQWTEFKEWSEYFKYSDIAIHDNISRLIIQ